METIAIETSGVFELQVGWPRKLGRVAFITTPNFRAAHPQLVERFVYRHLYSLCTLFEVLCTGRTYDLVMEIINRPLGQVDRSLIAKDARFPIKNGQDLARWRRPVIQRLRRLSDSFPGMIEVTYELVEGRLDAVIHLTDWEDISAKSDSAVLRREANVHDIPIASDIHCAEAYVAEWNAAVQRTPGVRLFQKRSQPKEPPLQGIKPTDRVLGMVAHDAKKLELCCFAVRHARELFQRFDYILATGTTGTWLRCFMEAAGRPLSDLAKIRCCHSGPQGGDVQIAYAVVKKLCHEVVFFQDPFISHAHDSDIRLFEQAVVAPEVRVALATNAESARLILGS